MSTKSHAQERALQRYNQSLSYRDINQIGKLLTAKQYLFLKYDEVCSDLLFAYVTYKKIPYKVLFKTSPLKIITVYPFDADEYNSAVEKQQEIINSINILKSNGYTIVDRFGELV